MNGNRESGYITTLTLLTLTASLLVAGVVGVANSDLAQREEEPPAVTPINLVSQPSLFLLGDGINPTLPGLAAIAGSGPGPDWRDLFAADGTLRDDFDANGVRVPGGNGIPDAIDRFGGRAAVFIGDDVSAGRQIDLTVPGSGPSRWKSGLVAAEQDLGNSYVYLTSDTAGGLILYAGVERLIAARDSWVNFELNQEAFQLREGDRSIVGRRTPGDVRIRLNFGMDGVLSGIDVSKWSLIEPTGFDFVSVEAINGEGCSDQGTLCAFSNADSIEGGSWKSFDASGGRVDRLAPGTFTELGVNLGSLLGSDPEYGGTQIQSPLDLALGTLVDKDGSGNPDIVTGIGCMEDEAGFGLNCTANDVSIANVQNIVILDDGCAFLGDTVTFSAEFEVLLTAQARHDVGLWFSTDGDPDGDGALSGMCTAATPPYAPDTPWLDLDGTGDDPDGVIQDTCGDIDANHNPLFPIITLTATCTDADGNGKLDLPNCTSWRQPGGNDLCTSPQQAFPGAPSKCKCSPGFQIDIDVPACADDCSTLDDACNVGVCDIVGDCDIDGSCQCVAEPKADSTPCEDGNVCTSETGDSGTPDHCFAGVCTGIPVDCSALDDSCIAGVCNAGTGACEPIAEADSTPCEDGNACTSETGAEGTPDHCFAGVCTGIPVACGPGDQCNDDVCDPGTGTCELVPKADSTPCEDGDFCTSETGTEASPDHCFAGVCTGIPVGCGPGDQCNDDVCNPANGTCELVPKADSTPCEDGDFCTSETGAEASPDHCEAGTCVGIPVGCGPGDQCNDDVCDPGTGTCELVPKADSTPCEDGDFCTSETGAEASPDHCFAGVCTGIPVGCGPGDQCNEDVCDPGTGTCELVPKADSTPCEDGDFCTSETGAEASPDHCEAGTCVGIPVACGPGDQCNDEVCDSGTGTCAVIPKADSTPCEDGNACTSETGAAGTPDHCEAGQCVGVPADCIAVTKTPNVFEVADTGGPVTFTVTVTNVSGDTLQLVQLIDAPFGDITDPFNPLITGTDCSVPQNLAPSGNAGDSYTCQFSVFISGLSGTCHTDVVAALAFDSAGNPATGDDDAEVCFESPLVVTMEYFTAELTPRGVLLKWKTGLEMDHAGFRILRGSNTRRTELELITPELIPARGNDLSGASYQYLIPSTSRTAPAAYYLEAVNFYGKVKERFGPATVQRTTRSAPEARRSR